MATIADLLVKVRADISNLESKMSKAQRSIEDTGRKMQKVGRAMSMAITAPMVAMGAASIRTAGNFEDSFANIRKTVDTTEPVFQQMSDEIRDLARSVPTSVEELNRLGGVAGQLGVEAGNIVDFTKVIAQLGDTTDIAGEQAALSLSRFMNVMGTAEGDIDRLGSTIVGLGNNFAAMESEIIDIATSMAPLGNSIGLTEQNVLALSTAIAASGGEARAASTAFQKTANTMQRAVLEGTEDLQIFAETAGMSAEQFRKSFQEDSFNALLTFMEGLRRVQLEGESMAAVLDEIGLADQRLIREFGKVTGNLDQVRQATSMANEEWERNTALSEEAQKRYATFNSQMKIFWNTVKDLGITIGNTLIPVVTSLTDMGKQAISVFQSFGPIMKGLSIALSGILAVSGPVIWFFGTMATHVGTLMRILPKVVSAFKALNLTMLANPYVAVGAAIGVIAVSAYTATQRVNDLHDSINDVIDADIGNLALDEVNKTILETQKRIDHIAAIDNVMGGAAKEASEEWQKLNDKMERLRNIRNELIAQGVGKEFGQFAINQAKELDTFIGFVNDSFTDLNLAADTTELEKPFVEASRSAVDMEGTIMSLNGELNKLTQSPSMNIGEKMFPPGSLGFLQQKLSALRESLRKATDPELIRRLQVSIRNVQNDINNWGQTMSGWTTVLQGITQQFVNSFGQGLNNIVVQGQRIVEVLENIGKLLASAVIQKGIQLLLTGGLSGVGGFFGSGGGLFGAIGIPGFASGGLAFGPTLAVVGDNKGARSNPEVIAPLSKLEGMMGGSNGKVQVEGTIRGDVIHLANIRGQNKFR